MAGPNSRFAQLLTEQVGHEFTASQQYVAIAVHYDADALPQLARRFYAQAVEERNHAMMLVQYLLDRELPVTIPATGPVRNDFADHIAPVALALEQEERVTDQIVQLAKAARDDGDYVGEQFVQWFLKEQIEEVAAVGALLRVLERAQDDVLSVEQYLARETATTVGPDPTAPKAAGGTL